MNELAPTKVHNCQQLLIAASQKLVPWWTFSDKDILKVQTEQNPKSYLDSYYLFPLSEISFDADCDDIQKFINDRFHNILAAASHSGFSVALLLSSKNGNSEVFLGFNNESSVKNDPKIFESIVNGILPGKKITLQEITNISSLANGYLHGGVVTGVPILKKDDEKNKFNLSSVTRSLYGNNYLLAIISRPVSELEKQDSFNELIHIRDELHALAKRTMGESNSSTLTEGSSKTTGSSAGVAFFANYSSNSSHTDSESRTEQKSSSLSVEKQNGYALELEKIADQYIERIINGLGAGYWETTITFAAQDETASNILAGTLAGELSKPSDKLLPPPRIYQDALEEKILFIPKISSSNTLFPKSLSSYITSEELSLVSSPPIESVPGYEIQKMPALALTDNGDRSAMILGAIADHGNPIHNNYLYLSKNDLNKHLFVCGLTGSGKTTTVKHILKTLAYEEVPFLVVESAKRDYRQLLADDVFKKNLNIFTIGDATVSPIRINPFYIQEGVHPLVHIDYLKAIFNASFSLYGPMPSIVEKCLHAIYIKKGWDLTIGVHPNFFDSKGEYDAARYQFEEHYYCFPTLSDLKNEVDYYITKELDYKGELRDNIRTAIIVRLESLCVGAKGLMFNTHDFFSIKDLLSKNTILEMESLADDDDKAFFVGLVLVLISEYRQKENPAVNPGVGNKGLRHFMVIEEAHRLLKNLDTERTSEMMGNPKGKAVEVFCNILSEMRSLGQGVAVVEQIPSKISPDVIKNSNTKIVHRLVSKDDQSLLAGSLSIDDHAALYLNRLKTGHALCHKEGMGRPVECAVLSNVMSHAISDDKVKRLMAPLVPKPLHSYQAYQMDTQLGNTGKELVIQFFNSILILQAGQLIQLREIAKERIKKILVLKNVAHLFSDALFSDYFSLQIMMQLNKGVYYKRNHTPNNLKEALTNVIDGANEESKKELLDQLSIFWKPISAKNYIESVVEELTVEYLRKQSKRVDMAMIESTVSSHFLCSDNDTLQSISRKVKNRMDSYHAGAN